MADTLLTLTILAFFGIAFLYVLACDRIVGPDSEGHDTAATEREPEKAAS